MCNLSIPKINVSVKKADSFPLDPFKKSIRIPFQGVACSVRREKFLNNSSHTYEFQEIVSHLLKQK